MKRILQVTLFDDKNIGNRLQNYALQEVLIKKECEVTNLRDRRVYHISGKQLIKNNVKHILSITGNKKYKQKYEASRFINARWKIIHQFSEEYIHHIIDASKGIDKIELSNYDLAIVGSDQVWHNWKAGDPDFVMDLSYYYLSFLPPEKRAAYGASFGFDKFLERDLQAHMNGLQGMHYISCREQSGCDLVQSVTGKDVPHVLDPTLLLDASDWRKLESKANAYSKNVTGKYAFVFFLGNETEEYKQSVERECQKNSIDTIIDFNDFSDDNIASCGPIEFLYLIDHAQYIFTDSFHCTVFSILFDKNFVVYRRLQDGFTNMFGRIEELLKMTGHMNNAYGGVSNRTKVEDFEIIKRRSLDYLDLILK